MAFGALARTHRTVCQSFLSLRFHQCHSPRPPFHFVCVSVASSLTTWSKSPLPRSICCVQSCKQAVPPESMSRPTNPDLHSLLPPNIRKHHLITKIMQLLPMPQALHFALLQDILVAGKPHLGTDRLVRILRRFRQHLLALGVQVHFGACATDFAFHNGRVTGVQLRGKGYGGAMGSAAARLADPAVVPAQAAQCHQQCAA